MTPFYTRGVLNLWRVADAIRRPSRVSRKRAKLIAQMSGEQLANSASAAAFSKAGANPKFLYDAQASQYVVVDSNEHRFAHPARVYHYLAGLEARGKKLAQEYLIEKVPMENGDHVVDVGANVGDFGLALKARGVSAKVTAFEPSPLEFAALTRNLGSNDAVLSHKALNLALWSNDAEKMTFYLKSQTADSSLLPIDEFDEAISVSTARLDSQLERRPYKLLKLEAEGAEPEILDGAEGVLDCFEYVTADVGFERGMRQDSTLPEVAERLCAKGFKITAVGRERLVLLFQRVDR